MVIVCILIAAALCIAGLCGMIEEIPQFCPYCGDPLNDESHWCDGKIEAIRNSQKNLFDNADKIKGKSRERQGRRIVIIKKCNCGKIGNVEVMVDTANKGHQKEVFQSGYVCDKCKEES